MITDLQQLIEQWQQEAGQRMAGIFQGRETVAGNPSGYPEYRYGEALLKCADQVSALIARVEGSTVQPSAPETTP